MNDYKNLKVWQKAVELATEIYELTNGFPNHELYGLTSQMRRSAISISSNIAEGAGRNSKKELLNFLSIAHGSSYELETQLIIANKIGLLSTQKLNDLTDKLTEIQKMNTGLKKSVNINLK